MKRVIIVPVADTEHFHGCEVIHHKQNLAALAGDTTTGRSRSAYASEEAFLEAVALGIANRYTFETLAEAARFREKKLSEMVNAGKRIEEKLIGPQAEPQKTLQIEPSPHQKSA